LLGEQDLAPSTRGFHSNNQDFAKQALMHCMSTLTSKALAIECMGSKYKTHEELDGNLTQTLSVTSLDKLFEFVCDFFSEQSIVAACSKALIK